MNEPGSSLLQARLDDGSTVEITAATDVRQVSYDLAYGPGSVGGETAKRKGYRHFAGQWWLPTPTGVVPLARVVEFIEASGE